MTARLRPDGPIFAALLGLLLLGLLACAARLALAAPVPAQPAQFAPSSPEPPQADGPCDEQRLTVPYAPPGGVPPGSVPPGNVLPGGVAPSGGPLAGDPPVPLVAIRVRVPETLAPGKDLEYHITVENSSRADAHHVLVRNPLPANARLVSATPEPATKDPDLVWDFGTLKAGARKEITLVLAPTGEGDVRNCARVQFEHGECVTTRITRPELLVEKRGPKQALLHDVMRYQIVLTNNSAAEITGIEVRDELDKGLQHRGGQQDRVFEVAALTPGQTRTLAYDVVANAVGEQCNHVTVRAAGGLVKKTESCVTIVEPKLELHLEGPRGGKALVQAPTAYPLTVANTGTAAATNVAIQAKIPTQAQLVGLSPGGRRVNERVEWRLGTLPPGTSRTVQYVLQAPEAGEVHVEALALADRGLQTQADVRTAFEKTDLPAGVHLSVINDDGNKVEVRKKTRYIITVLNQGNGPLAGVELVATVPEQMQLDATDPPVKPEGRRVTFKPAKPIEPGKTARFQVEVTSIAAGEAHFEVEMKVPGLPQPISHDEATTIYEAEPGRVAPQSLPPGKPPESGLPPPSPPGGPEK